ncbi:MAG TPA: phosphodiester glycosidase family protein [Puia sp.]|nr:phosphodiester glycosidase family protein [Puia sp.]
MLVRKLSLLLFLVNTICFSFAQLRWKRVDSLYGPLPASLNVYRTKDSLDGHAFLAFYASVRLNDNDLLFTTRGDDGDRYTPARYFQLEKFPLLLVNCSFFSLETGQNLSLLMKKGRLIAYNVPALKGMGPDSMYYYYPTRSAIGIDRNRRADVAWIFNDSAHRRPYAFEEAPVIARGSDPSPGINDLKNIEWKWWEMRTAVGGGPTLVHDAMVMVTSKEEQMFPGEENERTPRTAMGYTADNRLIILVIQGRTADIAEGATLREEAKIMKDLGCVEALNLNGGGSSCMLVNGKETIRPSDKEGQRPIPAVFMVKWAGRSE